MFAPVAPYRPDSPRYNSGASGLARNCLPLTDQSYGPLPSLVEQGNALTARCQGASAFRGEDGTVVNFAGDATKLYLWDGTAWNDVSRLVGGAYATPAEGRWVFIQFENYVVALNGVDADQVWTIGSSSNFVALSTLGDTPVVARYAAVCQSILMLGHTATNVQGTVNSDFFNIGEWTAGTGAADDQDLPNSGRITGMTSGQYINIFQERRITLATPTKSIPAFQYDPVSEERGCVVPGSIASFQQTTFFIANDGFFRLDGGQALTPIGDKEVDREFWDNVDQNYLYRVTATVDPRRKLYICAFPDGAATSGNPNRMLIYNWSNRELRWTTTDFGVDVLFFMLASLGYNMDNMDGVYPNLDTMSISSLDSELLNGSPIPKLAAFTSNKKLAFFEGSNYAATVDSVEQSRGGRGRFDVAIPMIEGTSVAPTISIGVRDKLNDAVSFDTAVSPNTYNECFFRKSAKFLRARMTTSLGDSWTHIRGIEFDQGGNR